MFLLPGVGAQGGDVASLAPAFAPHRAGGPRDRLALDRRRARGDGRRSGGVRTRRGGAPARPGVGARLGSPVPDRRGDGSPQPRAVPRAACAGGLRGGARLGGPGVHPRGRTARPPEPRTAPPRSSRPRDDDGTGKRTRRVRKSYVVKQGDTASSIAERYDVPLSQIEDLNPELDPQALAPGTRSGCDGERPAPVVRPARGRPRRAWPRAARRLLAAAAAAAALALAPPAAPPRRRSAPRRRSSSTAAPARCSTPSGPTARRSIASTTKLMTALLVLERERLSSTVAATAYRAASVESQIGLRAGERLTVADLMRGLLLPSANDAAATLAQAVSGSRRRFVAAMNDRARRARAQPTRTSPTRSASTSAATTRPPATSRRSRRELRRNPFFQRTVDRASVKLESGDAPADARQPQRARALRAVGRRGQDGPHAEGGLRARRLGPQRQGRHARRRSCSARRARRRATRDTLALLRWGFSQYTSAASPRRGRVVAQVPIAYRRGAELPLVLGRSVRRAVRRNAADPYSLRLRSVSVEVRGPIRRGQRLGTADIFEGGRRVTSVPVVAAGAVPAAGLPQRLQDAADEAVVGRPGGGRPGRRPRAASGAAGAARRPRRALGAGGRMIITVTLNTAIDKTLAVPELPARPAPPHRRADDDAGRQGRQRRARAQDARPARDRDGLRRRPDRHAASWSSSRACRC